MRKLLMLGAALLTAAACANNADDSGTVTQASTPAADQGGVQKCQQRTLPAPPRETDTSTKPKVVVPDGAPPCTLAVQDIKVGTGAAAKAGGSVTVNYVGVAWSTKEQFDSSWDAGKPVSFSLDQVIAGWREGIPGMREGGRRRLIIPANLAYAEQGGPGIAPGETLVFVVDLVKAS